MKLSIGIVGLPNVGKSTLFKLLTKQDVVIANYPFATVDPNIGIVAVPDERLEKIAELVNSEKVVPAVIEFFDIAGLVEGAHKGEGLGNQFLAKIREVSAIAHVVRIFQKEDISHISERIDPIEDIDTVHRELILKDLETVERRLEKTEHEVQTGGKEKMKELDALRKLRDALRDGRLVASLSDDIRASETARELFLLTAKPEVYVLNGKAEEVGEELLKKIKDSESEFVAIDAAEAEDAYGLVEKAYDALGLITFFTITGGREVRAWAVPKGTSVRDAAGEVHTDFREKFIRAEIVSWDKLLEAGGWREARARGWIRTEGREYKVEDGDVVEVRHG